MDGWIDTDGDDDDDDDVDALNDGETASACLLSFVRLPAYNLLL